MSIHAAFIAIQKAMPSLIKDAQGHGYKYPTLNQILDIVLPICHRHEVGLTQKTHPVNDGNGVGVETIIFNAEGQVFSSGVLAMPLTTDSDGNIMNVGNVNKQGKASGQYGAQAYGSALSYSRRYSLTTFFGMKAEDDDGRTASQPKVSNNPEPAKTEAQIAVDTLRSAKSLEELKTAWNEVYRWRYASKDEFEWVENTKNEMKKQLDGWEGRE